MYDRYNVVSVIHELLMRNSFVILIWLRRLLSRSTDDSEAESEKQPPEEDLRLYCCAPVYENAYEYDECC